MQPVTITLDGREVSGHPGMSVLELAREAGVDIPTLCHDSHLSSIGACRICLVEDERSGVVVASCVTPIAPGMVINTRSRRVLEHRKTIVELMLASHPDSCLVCDKGNRCQLRQIASDLGIGRLELQRIPQVATIEEVNPFIARDLSKCILCAKCIRACQELVVVGAIDYFQRGFGVRPATLDDLPLEHSECTFCGACVALCPTGALMEKEAAYRGTTRNAVQTTCPYCGCGCSICLEVKDDRIMRATPGQGEVVEQGALCVRGSYGYDFVHSPDRLTKPLIRGNDGFEEASWERVLEVVADEFARTKDRDGPDSLAVLGSAKGTNEENYLLQRFARCVLGTNNIDNDSRPYNSATREGLRSSVGLLTTTNNVSALEQSDVIVVVGANPTSSAPPVGYAIKRAVKLRGAKLVLVDPRRTELVAFSHLWLRPKAGTDETLLNSLAEVIIEEGLLDEEFVSRKTDNFEGLVRSLGNYSLDATEAVTGIDKEEICAAARLYAGARQGAIVFGSGITERARGAGSVKAIANLALLTGNVGRRAGGIYPLQRESNGQGACDMGALPDFLPGYGSVTDAQVRRVFEERWRVSLPASPGLSALEIMRQARAGRIKGLYLVGENPVLSFPHSGLVTEALSSLDCLVVQDVFLTETASLAKVVLPAASFAEKEGTFTNFEGRVKRVRRAIRPLGESLPGWEIILRLASRMGRPLPFTSLQQVMTEIEETVPFYEGYTDSERSYQAGPDLPGPSRIRAGALLPGFARFSPAEYPQQADRQREEYPFALLTGSVLYHSGDGTRSSRAWRLKAFSPQAFLEMGAADAQKLGIGDGERVRVVSPLGELTVGLRVTDTLPEGTVFLPSSFPECRANRLIDIGLDSDTKTPSLEVCNVRIERVERHG